MAAAACSRRKENIKGSHRRSGTRHASQVSRTQETQDQSRFNLDTFSLYLSAATVSAAAESIGEGPDRVTKVAERNYQAERNSYG